MSMNAAGNAVTEQRAGDLFKRRTNASREAAERDDE
jgi:hypothetical protein